MKKLASVVLILTLCVSGVFAQVTFSGSAFMGVEFQKTPTQDSDAPDAVSGASTAINPYHREHGLPRFDLNAAVGRDNYGARLLTRAHGTDFTVRGAYAWADFQGFTARDSLRFSAGQFAEGQWVVRLDGDLPELDIDHVPTGFRLTYTTPLEGLSVGAVFRAEGQDAETFGKQAIFGGTFVHPVFNVVLVHNMAFNASTLFAFSIPSFGFVGLYDLSFGLNMVARNWANWDSTNSAYSGVLDMYQRIGYSISRPLSVSLIAQQSISGNPDDDTIGMMFGPGVVYRPGFLPGVAASLRVMAESKDNFSTTDLTIRPAIEKTLSGPSLCYIQYELQMPDLSMDKAVHTIGIGIEIKSF
ncbi:MAG: hypothetical protein FWD91_04210 [Treponema sp.]|nr:hypothetical protein [Treponema sp.]